MDRAQALGLSPTGTLKLRQAGVRGTVYRKTKLVLEGSVVGDGRLTLGSQWGSNRFFLPGQVYLAEGGTLELNGHWTAMTGMRIGVDAGARLSVGDTGGLSIRGTILCFDSITIGNGVYLADEVFIRDSDTHATSLPGRHTAPITIEDGVWVGLRATILKGVTIGRGSVVAAGSVVTRDVPPGTMVAGVPAKVRRHEVSWAP